MPTIVILSDLIWMLLAFAIGAAVGSWLNVIVGRIPLQKSVIWPPSRCMSCLGKLRFIDNLPIFGYLIRRGRCRMCGAKFSPRYLYIELLTGLIFAGLFYLDVVSQIRRSGKMQIPYLVESHFDIFSGMIPLKVWFYFFVHAAFATLLLIAALCDIDRREIPLSITLTGTLLGLMISPFVAWPWPSDPESLAMFGYTIPEGESWIMMQHQGKVAEGVHPWPVWGPLPAWLPPGSPQLGFVTALTGALVGTLMMRLVKFIFEQGLGREALGMGDADLMMMAGAFLGWQAVVAAFFIGALASIVLIPFLVFSRDRQMPFGPGLAIGCLVTQHMWWRFGPTLQMVMFDWVLIGVATFILVAGMFIASVFLGFVRGRPTETSA